MLNRFTIIQALNCFSNIACSIRLPSVRISGKTNRAAEFQDCLQPMATMATIARAAGVSPSVVSRIVNSDESLRVSKATRKRVEELIRELDYAPHAAARSLRSSKTGNLALVMHDLDSPVNAEIISGAQRAAARKGMAIILGEASRSGDCSLVEDLIGGGGVDGLILQGANTQMDRALSRAARRRIPTVHLQSSYAEDSPLIVIENEAAARIATEHLIRLGHRRIGFLHVDSHLPFSQEREDGWKIALSDAGIQPELSWQGTGGWDFFDGAAGIEKLLASAHGLTAVVSSNVISAIGALSKICDMGMRVPQDFSLVAVHDSKIAKYTRPAITTVRTPLERLAEVAVDVICSRVEPVRRRIVVSEPGLKLVDRMSAGPP